MRTGYSMALIVTALITSTMFFAVLCNYAVMGQVNGDGNVLLAITIVGNFVGSLILFFRLQSNH